MDEKEILDKISQIEEALKTATLTEEQQQEVVNSLRDLNLILDKVRKKRQVKKPKVLTEVKVSNLSEIPKPFAPLTTIRVANLAEIPVYRPPDSVSLKKPAWLPLMFAPFKPIKQVLDDISHKLDKEIIYPEQETIRWPKKPSEALPVRLSDGKEFINQLTQWVSSGGGGGGTPKVASTALPSIYSVPVVNPDGSNVSESALATKITVSGSITYVGTALPGTSQGVAKWQCMKIDETTGTVITYADGNSNYDNVATDLTTLSYS